jgi:hypothetical protein
MADTSDICDVESLISHVPAFYCGIWVRDLLHPERSRFRRKPWYVPASHPEDAEPRPFEYADRDQEFAQ